MRIWFFRLQTYLCFGKLHVPLLLDHPSLNDVSHNDPDMIIAYLLDESVFDTYIRVVMYYMFIYNST